VFESFDAILETKIVYLVSKSIKNKSGASLCPCAGGGIYNQGGTVTIVNSMLSTNTVQTFRAGLSSYGGGVYDNGTLVVVNTRFFGYA
jgi:hypothetical protein